MNPKDIIVYSDGTKPKGWGRFLSLENKLIRLRLDSGEKIKIPQACFVANVGPTPQPGKVYGVSIEPVVLNFDSSVFTEGVSVHAEHGRDWQKFIESKFVPLLKKNGCLRPLPASLKIYGSHKSKHGSYRFKSKATDAVKLYSQGVEDASLDAVDLYVLVHEYAHGLMYRYFGPKRLWHWTALHKAATRVEQIDDNELQILRETLEASGNYREFLGSLEDDVKPVLKQVLKYIRTTHSITPNQLDAGIRSQRSFEDIWPKSIELVERDTIITDYSRKNAAEFFAEAVAMTLTGHKVPSKIEHAVRETLRTLRSGEPAE